MSNIWNAKLCRNLQHTTLEWLWPRYLARGKLALLDGDPAMGKSVLTIDLIARLSRGGPLPDGSTLEKPISSLLLSAEDDPADTIRPRAEAAGVDPDRLVVPNFDGRIPQFPNELAELEALIREKAIGFVVIDPLMAFLPPGVAANLDQCVRRAFNPLAGLASRTGCAILFIRHLVKRGAPRAVRRGQGSMGILAAMRTGFLAAPHPTDSSARVLAVTKSNMGNHPPSLFYRIVSSPVGQPIIEWDGATKLTADEACQDPAICVRPRDRASDWLKRELAAGPRKASELRAAAAACGIPERTLERAKKELNIESHRHWKDKELRGEWYWYDRDSDWPKDAAFKKPYELPPLPPLDPLEGSLSDLGPLRGIRSKLERELLEKAKKAFKKPKD